MNISIRNNNGFFEGADACHRASLFEYGFLVSLDKDKDGDNLVLYRLYCEDNEFKDKYSSTWISENDLNNLVSGNNWADKDECLSFLSCVGAGCLDDWLKYPISGKLMDAISYWGNENIFGISYYPINLKQALRIYNKHEVKGV